MSAKTPEAALAGDAVEAEGQRLDKWLWYTRLVKTRTLAAKLVETGKVRVNTARVKKPARLVRPGDVITATLHRRLHVVKVLAPGARRGPAPEARTLYEDLTPAPENKAGTAQKPAPAAKREAGSGRPTKRERRKLDRLKQSG